MLTREARARLSIVLVGARNPQNIGAAARAMQDFGFTDLRVVNTFAPPFEAAQLEAKSAVAAGEIMRSARLFSSLAEAIADSTLTVGTTAIGGRGLTRPVLPLQEVVPGMLAHLMSSPEEQGSETSQIADTPAEQRTKVALLFGSEKTGLTNDQLSHCSMLLTIPMYAPEGRHLSMNLGQAVAVCLYELSRTGFEGARALPTTSARVPDSQDRERLLDTLTETMHMSDYTRRFPANARPEVVRQLSLQLGKTRDEVSTWVGFFRQIQKRLARKESTGDQ